MGHHHNHHRKINHREHRAPAPHETDLHPDVAAAAPIPSYTPPSEAEESAASEEGTFGRDPEVRLDEIDTTAILDRVMAEDRRVAEKVAQIDHDHHHAQMAADEAVAMENAIKGELDHARMIAKLRKRLTYMVSMVIGARDGLRGSRDGHRYWLMPVLDGMLVMVDRALSIVEKDRAEEDLRQAEAEAEAQAEAEEAAAQDHSAESAAN